MLASIQASYESMNLPPWLTTAISEIATAVENAMNAASWGNVVVGFIQGFLGIIGTLFAFLLLPFFLFYLLKDQPAMARNFYRQIPAPWKPDVEFAISTFITDFATYFKAELLVGAIMGVTVAIGMFIIGLIVGGTLGSFALLLGLIAFVMELIPQIGPIISYIPALLIALTISPLAVALVSVFYFIAFNIEGSVLVPTFEGRMVSFHGATVLLLITIGFALAGIIGAIVALPVASIIRDVFAHFFQKTQRESIVIDGVPVTPEEPGAVSMSGPAAA
jgi:predicted PurR-regulated permease PerM